MNGEHNRMKTRLVALALVSTGIIAVSLPTIAQEAAQDKGQAPDLQAVQTELQNARKAVEDARQTAEQIIADARKDADRIRQDASLQAVPPDLQPIQIRNAPVAVEINAGTVQEIATAIMPLGWRVKVDVKDRSLLQRRFQYVSTKSRDQALRDLLKPVGLQYHYFFDLKDAGGNSSPLLVISRS